MNGIKECDKEWRTSKEYRTWRIAVIRRDGKCKVCSSMEKREAHHLCDAHHHEELRYDVDNGITLCSKCHDQFHMNYKKRYTEICSADDIENFKAIATYYMKLNK